MWHGLLNIRVHCVVFVPLVSSTCQDCIMQIIIASFSSDVTSVIVSNLEIYLKIILCPIQTEGWLVHIIFFQHVNSPNNPVHYTKKIPKYSYRKNPIK